MDPEILYLGVKGSVVAVEQESGAERWRTHLKGSAFVSFVLTSDRIFAHTHGNLFCLDRDTGEVVWSNDLPGLGYGLAALAVEGASSDPVGAVHQIQAQQAAAASGGAVAASSGT